MAFAFLNALLTCCYRYYEILYLGVTTTDALKIYLKKLILNISKSGSLCLAEKLAPPKLPCFLPTEMVLLNISHMLLESHM